MQNYDTNNFLKKQVKTPASITVENKVLTRKNTKKRNAVNKRTRRVDKRTARRYNFQEKEKDGVWTLVQERQKGRGEPYQTSNILQISQLGTLNKVLSHNIPQLNQENESMQKLYATCHSRKALCSY